MIMETVTSHRYPSANVEAKLISDIDAGEVLDTNVYLKGQFCIAGSNVNEFLSKIGDLIDEYRI